MKDSENEFSGQGLIIEADFRLDAPAGGAKCEFALLGDIANTDVLTGNEPAIVKVVATASGTNGRYESITINGIDITTDAKLVDKEPGYGASALNRDTTG